MKLSIILGFAAQTLGVAVDRERGDRDPVTNRPFHLPNSANKRPDIPPFAPERHSDQPPHEGPLPSPDEVQIVGLTYGGSGCPAGTVSSVFSDDRTIMTLIFDEYTAEIGPGISPRQSRRNCQLNINLRYPAGFQYSVFSADYRGYAHLDKGVTGVQKSTYYFSGQTEQTSTETTWKGPMDKDYLLHDEADSTSVVWSPCGENGALNINSQIRLTSTNDHAAGLLTADSLDASFRQLVHVKWQECHRD